MQPITGNERPRRKKTSYPRIFANTPENLERSLERLARWALHKERDELELSQVRAACTVLRLRIELERIRLDREKWLKECELEERLEEIEAELRENRS